VRVKAAAKVLAAAIGTPLLVMLWLACASAGVFAALIAGWLLLLPALALWGWAALAVEDALATARATREARLKDGVRQNLGYPTTTADPGKS
jgi:membrane protein implicated in regulation of membrane protease activity